MKRLKSFADFALRAGIQAGVVIGTVIILPLIVTDCCLARVDQKRRPE